MAESYDNALVETINGLYKTELRTAPGSSETRLVVRRPPWRVCGVCGSPGGGSGHAIIEEPGRADKLVTL